MAELLWRDVSKELPATTQSVEVGKSAIISNQQ